MAYEVFIIYHLFFIFDDGILLSFLIFFYKYLLFFKYIISKGISVLFTFFFIIQAGKIIALGPKFEELL